MAETIATLGLRVTSQGVREAEQQLDKLGKTSEKVERQTAKVAPAMQQTAMSAKQLQAATRGLPAQFTDIATALGSGQRPLQVLLQQGGQLKDMFGGIGPAARAMGTYVAGLVSPLTLAAGAAAALALAWKQGQDEAENYNRALILTGGYADRTSEQLAGLAAEFDKLEGVTQGSAARALTAVAESGRFTGEVFDMVAEAAVRAEEASTKSIDETIKAFAAIQKDPVDALLKLNETERFLTQTQLDRIDALRDEGREQDAVAEATRVYFNVVTSRAGEVVENVNAIGAAWRNARNEFAEAWDYIKNIGRQPLPSEARFGASQLLGASPLGWLIGGQAGANALVTGLTSPRATQSRAPAARGPVVDSDAVRREREKVKQAEDDWARWQQQNLTRQQQQSREEAKIREAGLAAKKSAAEIEAEVAKSRQRFAESQAKRERKTGARADEGQSILARIRQQIALNGEELASQDRLTASDRLRISVQEQLKDARLNTTGATRAAIDAALKELDASGKALKAHQDEAKMLEELTRLQNELAAAEENRRRSNETDLLSISAGREEVDRARRLLDIEREYQDGLRELRDRGVAADSQSYRVQEAELRASRDRMLAEEADFQQKRAAMLGDWRNGANAAFQDFAADAANVAGQVYDIWRGAFDGLTNVITDFITTGKGDFKGFLDDLAREITSFIVKQQLSKWLQGLMGADANGGNQVLGGIAQTIFGGGWGGLSKGGAFGGGVQMFANGGVVDSPQLFRHGGRLGLMGEAGPEAIVPLHRGSDGKLGIRMNGGGGAVSQVFNTVIQGRMDRSTEEQFHRRQGREAARGLARTGR